MGVECDGATYHSSSSARDRDRHRQEVLENLGWKIHRIWSTDWFSNPNREADRLRKAIEARLLELKARGSKPLSELPIMVRHHEAGGPDGETKPVESQSEAIVVQSSAKPATPAPKTVTVRLGDTVRLRYLDKTQETYQFKIVKEPSQPERGIVNHTAPLAKCVMDTKRARKSKYSSEAKSAKPCWRTLSVRCESSLP